MRITAGFGAALALALAAAGAPAAAQETAAPAAPAGEAPAKGADTVVATVNGTEITLGHMIVLRASLPAQYQALPDEVLFAGILDQLVQQAALAQSVEGSLARRDRLGLENERRGFLAGVALQGEMKTAVTDAAVQAAYDARYKDAVPPTEYNASHILVETEERAAELRAEIDGGADFAELARANSKDGAAANGGDLGWFGLGMMVKPFEDAVVAMKPGEVSGPIETQFGWHLVRLNETRQGEIPALDAVRADLAAEIERKALEDHIARLTAAATVTRPGESLDPAVLRDDAMVDR